MSIFQKTKLWEPGRVNSRSNAATASMCAFQVFHSNTVRVGPFICKLIRRVLLTAVLPNILYSVVFEQRRSRGSIDSHWYVREEWAFLV